MKRLAIYFYYNEKGWIGDYVTYYLSKLKKYCDEICVVVNGFLDEESKEKLKSSCNVLLIHENKGFDSWAYKYAIEHYGYEKLKEYDEVILNNFTCYGPIYPLSEMFNEMDARDCDFWGINRHPELEEYLTEDKKDSKVLKHIQSYFLVFRNSIISNDSFKKYWETLKLPTTYAEAILFHEIRCSNYFEKLGFKSSTYMDFEKYKQYDSHNASLLCADKQHIEDRNPLVKRKIFFLDKKQWTWHTTGHIARDVFEYIDKNTDFDINLIWQDLLKTQKMSDLRNTLHLNYYLSKTKCYNEPKTTNVALILFVYYEDLVDYCLKYLQSMPEGSDIYLISSKESLLELYKKTLSDLNYNVKYKLAQNKGRDVSAYLIEGKEVFDKHEYVCCMHDKKSKHLNNKLQSEEFSYHCFENNLASKDFVKNIINTFNYNSKLGMLVPPTVNFGQYNWVMGNEIGACKKVTKEAYDLLNLEIPFDEHAVAPFGTMFWVRGQAFKSMYRHDWVYDDFPPEPNKNDGTILHGIERIYPMAVQNEGYYVGWLATQDYINAYLDGFLRGQAGPQKSRWVVITKRILYKFLSRLTFGEIKNKYVTKYKKYKYYIKN